MPRVRSAAEIRRRAAVDRGAAVWAWQARAFVREARDRAGSNLALAANSGVAEKTIRRLLADDAMTLGPDARTVDVGTLDALILADGSTTLEERFPLPEAA